MSDDEKIDWDTSRQRDLSYNSYLRVPELLDLQHFESDPPAHDELLFIIIHQSYELWFKLVLYELDAIAERLDLDDVYEAQRLLGRVNKIERILVEKIHILETMTPRDFLMFRKALNPASGFQSIQFREVEFASGIKRHGVMRGIELTDEQRERLEDRLEGPSLRTKFYETLQRRHFDVVVPDDRGDELSEEDQKRTFEALLRIYEHPENHYHLYSLAEALIEHDQNLLQWRFHHVRVVERLIGTKRGTGGSPGVRYLQSTLTRRAFPLLWAVRGMLSDEEFYGTTRGITKTLDGDDA